MNTIHEFIQVAESAAEVNPSPSDVPLANLKACRATEKTERAAGIGSSVIVVWVRGNKGFELISVTAVSA